jgi:two-component system response regulator YesN
LDAELQLFLEHGSAEQAEAFARQCAEAMGKESMEVPELSLYVLLRIRLAIQSYVIGLGRGVEELQKAVAALPGIEATVGSTSVVRYLTALLQCAVELRAQSGQHNLHPAVQQALLLLERRYTDPALTLASVAQEVGMTPNYFSTLFRRNVGYGFSAYLTQRRMAHAKDLLRFTKLSSAEVAAASGYSDARYFSAQFHRTQGCTPREYRSKKKEQH